MPWFQDRWEALAPAVQKLLQIAFGVLFAAGCAFFLYRSSDSDSSLVPLVISLSCVLFLPRVVETQTGNKLPLMRKSMLIALACFVVLSFVLGFRSGQSFFG